MSKCYPANTKDTTLEHTSDFIRISERLGYTLEQISELTGYSVRTVYRWKSGESTPRKSIINILLSGFQAKSKSPGEKDSFTFADLFAGIGGMRLGFESAGGKCVYTCEWNKYARQTYAANFELDHEIAGDIREVDAETIPDHDVLLAGFPCQPFYIAGVSKKNALGKPHGFACETQGTLFFDIARIIAAKRPAAFLLENVRNLERHDGGRTFRIIRNTLDELNYHSEWIVLNARHWTPQHRERIFIAGFRSDNGFSFDNFPLPNQDPAPQLSQILHKENGEEEPEPPYTSGPNAAVNPKYTLTEHLWDYLKKYADKHRSRGNGFGFGLVGEQDVARTLSARYYKDGSEILIRRDCGQPRRLTPRECARLMGFDAAGRPPFRIVVSDTQAYKQFGNAVVVPLVSAVANHMLPFIYGFTRELPGQISIGFPSPVKARTAAVG